MVSRRDQFIQRQWLSECCTQMDSTKCFLRNWNKCHNLVEPLGQFQNENKRVKTLFCKEISKPLNIISTFRPKHLLNFILSNPLEHGIDILFDK